MNMILGADASVAAVDDSGRSISYSNLRSAALELSNLLGNSRELVLLEGSNSIAWLIAYSACLIGRHPVLLSPHGNREAFEQLDDIFRPTVWLRASSSYAPEVIEARVAPELHPDLAVLLSTSGSTGSTKCVRLSYANILANAKSICEYLEMDSSERGSVNLPTHYSYGLSVVNSHLVAGATLLFSDQSIIEPRFWEFLRSNGATSFVGVPHTYDLISRLDFKAEAPSTLRYFTQAGGRLPEQQVSKFAQLAGDLGCRFYVMYGQTEAAPRMAFMPPDELSAHPGSIGVAIPDGRFELLDAEGQPIQGEAVGELVYYGPNVMMGYAFGPDQLADEPMDQRLATGDLARRDASGFLYITGRLSRFIKVFGNRIGLDDVEKLLARHSISAIATGIDDHLLVVTRNESDIPPIRDLVQAEVKLPAHNLTIRLVEEYPLLSSGKIDYAGLKHSLEESTAVKQVARGHIWRRLLARKAETPRGVREVFAEIFGEAAVEDWNKSFKDLGGDSLSYVSVAMSLEKCIPDLPQDWSALSISQLESMEDLSGSAVNGQGLFSNLDTLRGLACLLVVALHVVGGDPTAGLKISDGPWRWAVDSFDYFRMPIFTAMAGLLYAAMPAERGGYLDFVKRRASMLVLPILVATPIYWGVRHLVYGLDESLVYGFLHGYLHLWYLYALMLILAFVGGIDVLLKPSPRLWGGLVVFAPIVYVLMPEMDLLKIDNAVELMCYFAIGVLFYRSPQLLRDNLLFIVALIFGVIALGLQQMDMHGGGNALSQWPLWPFIGGLACVVVSLRLFPRIDWLGAVGVYSFSIYLWHPLFNAGMRFFLQHLGVSENWSLFTFGFLAGAIGPMLLQRVMLRFPSISRAVVGR